MAGPDWLRWLLTGAFLAVAGYCVQRLAVAAPGYPGRARAVDLAHVLMGAGMAVMCSPVGGPVPHTGWQVVFALLVVWFAGAWLTGQDRDVPDWPGRGVHHALASAAMLYLLTATPHDPAAMNSPWSPAHLMTGAAAPVLGWLLAGYLLVHGALVARRAVGAPALRRTGTCQVVMALGSVAMLATAL